MRHLKAINVLTQRVRDHDTSYIHVKVNGWHLGNSFPYWWSIYLLSKPGSSEHGDEFH
jgi:hypothetical protein